MDEKNIFPGINPHLNSALQQRGGGWKSFHAAHLMHLFEKLDAILPEAYYAMPENSLQIGTYSTEPDIPSAFQNMIADVLITRMGEPQESRGSASSFSSTPTLTLPIPQMLLEEEELTSVVIYHAQKGKPVTRIEILPPANKPQGSHYGTYLVKRDETLRAGLRLVELDYLHETRPMLPGIPVYADQEQDAFPYHIIVSDPRPTLLEGKVSVYSFGLMDALPVIDIPLDGEDRVQVNFGDLYAQTFSKRAFKRLVDYSQLPANFTAYSRADQDQIRQHIRSISSE